MASEEGQVGIGEMTAHLNVKDSIHHHMKSKALPVHMVETSTHPRRQRWMSRKVKKGSKSEARSTECTTPTQSKEGE